MAKRVMKNDSAVAKYLKEVGVRRYPSLETFRKYLEREYGEDRTSELFDAVDRRGQGEDLDIYPLLYSSLDLSIDFLGFETDLHGNYLRWLVSQYSETASPPARILDIGCGNGVLPCFYAKHFSQSQVIAIDSSADAIGCAEELAGRLHLTNVRFLQLNLLDSSLSTIDGGFDLITAIKVLGITIDLPEFDESVPLRGVLPEFVTSAQGQSLPQIFNLLTAKGVFVTLDRWSSLRSFLWWVCALNDAGFFIDFDDSSRVEYRSLATEEAERIPILLNRKSDAAHSQVEDAIAFWLHSKYTENLAKLKTFDFQHDLAEIVFASVNPKTFRFGIRSEHIEGGILWREIWQAGPFLLVFQFSANGHRQLEVLPSIFYESAEEHLRDLTKQDPLGNSVSSYDAPQCKWE